MKKEILIFFLFLLSFYIIIIFNDVLHLNDVIFSSPDSRSYKEVSDWIFGLSHIYFSLIYRPFFYPLLLGIRNVITNYGFWLLQAVFFYFSGFLIYKAIVRLCNSKFLAYVAVAILLTNLTLIKLTLHALTEITSLFLISLWIYLFSKNNRNSSHTDFLLVFILALLTVTRPVFSVMLSVYSAIIFAKQIRFNRMSRRTLIIFMLCFLPIIIQLLLMKSVFNRWELSRIGDYTVRAYLISKVYSVDNKLNDDLVSTNRIIEKMDNDRLFSYTIRHLPSIIKIYFRSLINWNMLEGSNFTKDRSMFLYSRVTNYVYFIIHMVAGLYSVIIFRFAKLGNEMKYKYTILYLFFLTILLSSGISFWQGDRLVVTSIPLWVTAYAIIFSKKMKCFVNE